MSDTGFADRLVERAARADLVLDARHVAQLATYFELLRAWNRKINLTALPLDPPTDEALDRLFVEPLAAAHWLIERPDILPAPSSEPPAPSSQLPAPKWIDLGSGGGSPAFPMKIALPALCVTMIESKSRKAAFLREAVRALALASAEVVNARFEDLVAENGTAQLVTVRAVRVDAELAAVAASLLVGQGYFLVFQSKREQPALSGFNNVESVGLLSERPSWLHVYSRLFHVEQ